MSEKLEFDILLFFFFFQNKFVFKVWDLSSDNNRDFT